MKSLENLNKFINLIISIYSYKINREDAKIKILNKELSHIIETYNEVNPNKIENEKEFIDNYVNPFINSWDLIKNKAVQYKCRILRNLDKGGKPLDIIINNKLC